jgi:hypothetical protein
VLVCCVSAVVRATQHPSANRAPRAVDAQRVDVHPHRDHAPAPRAAGDRQRRGVGGAGREDQVAGAVGGGVGDGARWVGGQCELDGLLLVMGVSG